MLSLAFCWLLFLCHYDHTLLGVCVCVCVSARACERGRDGERGAKKESVRQEKGGREKERGREGGTESERGREGKTGKALCSLSHRQKQCVCVFIYRCIYVGREGGRVCCVLHAQHEHSWPTAAAHTCTPTHTYTRRYIQRYTT